MTILPDLSANPQWSPTTTGKSVAARASANDKTSAAKTGRINSLFFFITWQEFTFFGRAADTENLSPARRFMRRVYSETNGSQRVNREVLTIVADFHRCGYVSRYREDIHRHGFDR